jgi:soluble lytic murein transglycosylase-like protein
VTAGSRYLAELIGRFGDLALALAAYNAGPRAVERSSGVPPYRETREYVRRVLATFCPGGGPGAVVGQEATP